MSAAWLRFVSRWPGALLVFLSAAFLAYAPALNGPLMWDDHYLVGANPFFRSPVFIGEVFRHWLYLDSTSHYYRPVQNLSYLLDYWLWGGAAFGYHFTNIVLHGLCGAALFALLRRLLGQLDSAAPNAHAASLGIALLWTVHPAHNAAVAYIAGRADSLAMLGAICAWLFADRAGGGRRIVFGVLAALCGVLALCAKELAIFWFVLFALHRVLIVRRPIAIVPALLVVGAYHALRSLPEARAAIESAALPLDERGLLMLRALGDYAGLLVWPARLMMDRSISSSVAHESYALWLDNLHFEYLSLIGLAALALVLWKCRGSDSGARWRIAGAVWFALGFLPVSNLFPLNAPVAEHWIYHASIGAFIFAAGCLRPWVWALVAAVAGVAFTVRTAVRAADWAEPERFFLKNIASGGGTPRIHSLLAQVYLERGDTARHEKLLRDLLTRFPNHPGARASLAASLARQGRKDEADALSSNEPADTPRRPAAAWETARAEAQRLLASGDTTAARAAVETFAAAHWWHLDAWLALAELRLRTGDRDAAIAALRAAARLDVHDPRAAQRLAALRLARGSTSAPIAPQP